MEGGRRDRRRRSVKVWGRGGVASGRGGGQSKLLDPGFVTRH